MAVLHPFSAHKPSQENIQEVACVPYDVINTKEARERARKNPKSFLHVIRPEIDLPGDIAFDDDAVYKKGAENLEKFIRKGILEKDDTEAIYIYRLTWEERSQTGIFGCVSVEDYDNEIILKHELTRPDKEDDRTRHIVTQGAHAEPVMITCKNSRPVQALTKEIMAENKPLFDFRAGDEVRHTLWKVQNSGPFVREFSGIGNLYIADGHHRCKSASRTAEKMREGNENHTGEEEYNFFPAVLFPMPEMNILPYNRVVHTIPSGFAEQLQQQFEIFEPAPPSPANKGEISIYLDGTWKGVALPLPDNPSSVEILDVHRLQTFILEPLLDIENPRTDHKISFVGGIRGTETLETMVNTGEAEVAISMYPTSIEELVNVSDEGLLMPPKSTWFEPKLRSGILVHTF